MPTMKTIDNWMKQDELNCFSFIGTIIFENNRHTHDFFCDFCECEIRATDKVHLKNHIKTKKHKKN